LDQLAISEREKKASIEQLEAEERRLQAVVAELSVNARQADQARIDSWERRENEHTSVVGKLVARELELRGHIDQLEVCLNRLQDKVNRATEEEREWQSRIERLAAMEKEQHSALASLAPTESQGPGQARPGSVSGEEPAASSQGQGPSGRDTRVGLEKLIRTALDSDEEPDEPDEHVKRQREEAEGASSKTNEAWEQTNIHPRRRVLVNSHRYGA
jgi:hypothetical protein